MLFGDGGRSLMCRLRSPNALAAENLFLRKQLALDQGRHVKPQRATHAARLTLTWLARCCNWRQALVIVQPATLIRWHRQGFRLFWGWKSQCGRPPLSWELQACIRHMAQDNPTWGEERIANELRTIFAGHGERLRRGRGLEIILTPRQESASWIGSECGFNRLFAGYSPGMWAHWQ
jgi:hypothetical protein